MSDPFKQNLAQTFTSTASVTLRYVELPMACGTDVLARIQILPGRLDGTLLWDCNYDVMKAYQDGTFSAFQIYGGLTLTAGVTYAIVMSTVPARARPSRRAASSPVRSGIRTPEAPD